MTAPTTDELDRLAVEFLAAYHGIHVSAIKTAGGKYDLLYQLYRAHYHAGIRAVLAEVERMREGKMTAQEITDAKFSALKERGLVDVKFTLKSLDGATTEVVCREVNEMLDAIDRGESVPLDFRDATKPTPDAALMEKAVRLYSARCKITLAEARHTFAENETVAKDWCRVARCAQEEENAAVERVATARNGWEAQYRKAAPRIAELEANAAELVKLQARHETLCKNDYNLEMDWRAQCERIAELEGERDKLNKLADHWIDLYYNKPFPQSAPVIQPDLPAEPKPGTVQAKFVQLLVDGSGDIIALDEDGKIWRWDYNEDMKACSWVRRFSRLPSDPPSVKGEVVP